MSLPDLTAWEPLVSSPLAKRIATVVELGGSFPVLTDDPLEQFLVEEAVLLPHAIRKAEDKREEDVWSEAFAQAREGLR